MQGYKLAKEFDKYLLNKSKELYEESNVSFIKIYRNLRFLPTIIIYNRTKKRFITIARRLMGKK